jgi:hypothetical protein
MKKLSLFVAGLILTLLVIGFVGATPTTAATPIVWAVRTDLPVLSEPKPGISPDGVTVSVVGQADNPVNGYLLWSSNNYAKNFLGAGYNQNQVYNPNGTLIIAWDNNHTIYGRKILPGGATTNWQLSLAGEQLDQPNFTFCNGKYYMATRAWTAATDTRPFIWESTDGTNWAKIKQLTGGYKTYSPKLASTPAVAGSDCDLYATYNIDKRNMCAARISGNWGNDTINVGWDINAVAIQGAGHVYYTSATGGNNYIGEGTWDAGAWRWNDTAIFVGTLRVKSLDAVSVPGGIVIATQLLDERAGNPDTGFYYAVTFGGSPSDPAYTMRNVVKLPEMASVAIAAQGNKLVATAWLANHNTMLATANLPGVPITTTAPPTATTSVPTTTAPPVTTTPPAVAPPGTLCAPDIVLNEAPNYPIKCKFADYYSRVFGGDLARAIAFFGLPLGVESGGVQQFERQRFELHPEFAGSPYEVELGLVNKERIAAEKKLADIQAVLKAAGIKVSQ